MDFECKRCKKKLIYAKEEQYKCDYCGAQYTYEQLKQKDNADIRANAQSVPERYRNSANNKTLSTSKSGKTAEPVQAPVEEIEACKEISYEETKGTDVTSKSGEKEETVQVPVEEIEACKEISYEETKGTDVSEKESCSNPIPECENNLSHLVTNRKTMASNDSQNTEPLSLKQRIKHMHEIAKQNKLEEIDTSCSYEFNEDHYYDDRKSIDTPKADAIPVRVIIKGISCVLGIFLAIAFIIYYI